jgi:hypothetical protein
LSLIGERQEKGKKLMAAARTPLEGRRTRGRANGQQQVRFADKLVLNQWMLSLFNVKSFNDLPEPLRNEALEGLDENNVHHFHHAL